MSDLLFEAKGGEVTYGASKWLFGRDRTGVRVLHGVDLSIRRGETVGIVGESGSGKTTLGRALLKLVPLSAGIIGFYYHNITHVSRETMRPLRRRMQIIFQDPMASLNPRHTIRLLLTEPLFLHGLASDCRDADRQVRAVLERVSLPAVALDRAPHESSGGQRQRVRIARAVLMKPDSSSPMRLYPAWTFRRRRRY